MFMVSYFSAYAVPYLAFINSLKLHIFFLDNRLMTAKIFNLMQKFTPEAKKNLGYAIGLFLRDPPPLGIATDWVV